MLLHYLDESKRPPLLDYKPKSDKALLVDLVMNNPELKPKQLFQLKQYITIGALAFISSTVIDTSYVLNRAISNISKKL